MECRPFEVKLISANDIRNVNRFTTMDVYSFVLIAGDPRTRQKSPTDRCAGTSPKWNYAVHFTVDEEDLQKGSLTLVFQLRSERHLGDRDIGEVHIPLKELLDSGDGSDSESGSDSDERKKNKEYRVMTYDLKSKTGRQKGTLDFSYLFGDKFKISSNPASYVQSKPAKPAKQAKPAKPAEDENDNTVGVRVEGIGGLSDKTEDGGLKEPTAN